MNKSMNKNCINKIMITIYFPDPPGQTGDEQAIEKIAGIDVICFVLDMLHTNHSLGDPSNT